MNEIALLVAAMLAAGVPLALAGLGLVINERAGVVNLGAEGMMLIAAMTGFAVAFHTDSQWLAFLAGALAGAAGAAIFGWLVIWLNTNQYATGLALSLFGFGLSAFVGRPYVGKKLDVDTVFHTYPEVKNILGEAGFQRPAEAWDWIDERLSAHRVLMGRIQARGMRIKSLANRLETEDDGA